MDNATGSYEDLVYKIGATQFKDAWPAIADKIGITPEGTFTADYRVHAFIPSIGLTYSF